MAPLLHKQQNFLTDVANLTQLVVYSCKTWQKKFFFLHKRCCQPLPGRFVLLTLFWTITYLIQGIYNTVSLTYPNLITKGVKIPSQKRPFSVTKEITDATHYLAKREFRVFWHIKKPNTKANLTSLASQLCSPRSIQNNSFTSEVRFAPRKYFRVSILTLMTLDYNCSRNLHPRQNYSAGYFNAVDAAFSILEHFYG